MHAMQLLLTLAFGAALGLILGWMLWGEKRK
jgi:hypothetical protein